MATKHDGLGARFNAWFMGHGSGTYNNMVDNRKKRLFGDMSGRILEIGAGAGANIPYLNPDIDLTVLDPNPFMRPYFTEKATEYGISFDYIVGSAEQMEFEDASFDHVITTLVLCSVDNLQQSLKQIYRVLKPGGSFRFMEHVAAPQNTWLKTIQRGIRPLWQSMAEGCRPDRNTWINLQQAGFSKLMIEHFWVHLPVVAPHVMGRAEK